VEASTGIIPFDLLVHQVMTEETYRTAVQRLQQHHSNLVPVHVPIDASWLNQVEIYLSILQRKVLTPPEAESLIDLAAIILGFQSNYEELARPFEWKFTRSDGKATCSARRVMWTSLRRREYITALPCHST
jgi:hypothetical protein